MTGGGCLRNMSQQQQQQQQHLQQLFGGPVSNRKACPNSVQPAQPAAETMPFGGSRASSRALFTFSGESSYTLMHCLPTRLIFATGSTNMVGATICAIFVALGVRCGGLIVTV